MAFLAKSRDSEVPLSPGKPRLHEVVFEIFGRVPFRAKGINFQPGYLGLLLSTNMLKQRKTVDEDGALRWLSGLIAKKPENHPPWEKALLAAIPENCICAYEAPGSPENFTTYRNPDDAAFFKSLP